MNKPKGSTTHSVQDDYLSFVVATLESISYVVPGQTPSDLSLTLTDIFIAPRLSSASGDGSPGAEACTASDLLASNCRCLIVGDAGTGKTALLRHLALETARSSLCTRDDVRPIPVLSNLASWEDLPKHGNASSSIEERLYASLAVSSGDARFVPVVQESLRRGTALVLLDALDEIGDPATRRRTTRDLEPFSLAYPQAKIVVASRMTGIHGIKGFSSFRLLPWDEGQVQEYVHRWSSSFTSHLGVSADPESQAREVLSIIEASSALRELARNPLYLALILLVHRHGYRLPARRVELYDRITGMMLAQYDAARGPSKGLPPRVSASLAGQLLARVAWHLTLSNRRLVTATELGHIARDFMLSSSLPAEDISGLVEGLAARIGPLLEVGPRQFGFIHVVFQEFFAAKALAAMSDADALQFITGHFNERRYDETIRLALALADSRGGRREFVARVAESMAKETNA